MLGYPDQAAQKGEEAIQIARAISHPFSLAYALGFAAQVYRNRREYQLVQKLAEEKISIATEKNFTYSGGIGMMLRGSALAHQGELDQGLAQLRQGLAVTRSTGALWARCYFLGLLVEALCVAQQYNAASDTLREAQQVLQESDDQQWNAEILRLQGEVMLKQDDEVWAHTPTSLVQSTTAQAEEYFHQAHQIAKQQNTKALELRVAVSLAQLWRQQGKSEEAYAVLAPIYNWFTEGFDTDDLHKAKQLLEALR